MGERVGQIAKVPEVKQSNSNSRVRRTKRLQSMDTPVDHILFLQRTAGNQAVSRLMKSKALQAKLRIGQPVDVYEQEADMVADAVMQMPEPGVQRQVEPEEEERLQAKPLANQITPLVQVQHQKEPEEEEETLHAKLLASQITPLVQVQHQEEPEEGENILPTDNSGTDSIQTKGSSGKTPTVTRSVQRAVQVPGPGKPVKPIVRLRAESVIGTGLGHVRVHQDNNTHEAAQSIQANAFSHQNNIWLGKGQSPDDTGLMAHELTHVVQQSKGRIQRHPASEPRTAIVASAAELASWSTESLIREYTSLPSESSEHGANVSALVKRRLRSITSATQLKDYQNLILSEGRSDLHGGMELYDFISRLVSLIENSEAKISEVSEEYSELQSRYADEMEKGVSSSEQEKLKRRLAWREELMLAERPTRQRVLLYRGLIEEFKIQYEEMPPSSELEVIANRVHEQQVLLAWALKQDMDAIQKRMKKILDLVGGFGALVSVAAEPPLVSLPTSSLDEEKSDAIKFEYVKLDDELKEEEKEFDLLARSFSEKAPQERIEETQPERATPQTDLQPVQTPVCTTRYQRATNFQSLIDLVRAAETRLNAAGITSTRVHIHALRGIYYGTTWSQDYAVEHSTIRNEGFQRFTRPSLDPSRSVPRDVRPLLDCGLFVALQSSQDITDGSRHVDFGHLIIGLDARYDPAFASNIQYPVMFMSIDMGGTGPELVTWLGDLGGGAAALASRRVSTPATNARSVFTGTDYGGSINLEGDIAGFVVATSGRPTALMAPTFAPGRGRLSDALQDYLSPSTPGAAWTVRATTFLRMYGGTFDASSNALTNSPTLITTFSGKIQIFACNYLASRVRDGHMTYTVARTAADHIISASRDVATAFVNALEDSHRTGNRIEAGRFPSPSPASPGACTQQLRAAGLFDTFGL